MNGHMICMCGFGGVNFGDLGVNLGAYIHLRACKSAQSFPYFT
jgi:hypothetical protein